MLRDGHRSKHPPQMTPTTCQNSRTCCAGLRAIVPNNQTSPKKACIVTDGGHDDARRMR